MQEYCNSLTKYSRWSTREVSCGDIAIGGGNPIRIQSMTTTDTMDTRATIDQSIRMIKAGCEIVRITAPSLNEAKNLKDIKIGLSKKGIKTPIVADIHFTPNAALVAARIVEKVRINPGNYADRKQFKNYEYSDQSYIEELDRIRNKFLPLVNVCKQEGTAMRIGTNHGSLSDRIMSRFGDTPIGMVESAMEFLRIAKNENYNDIVLSMKASNTQVMIQAYRLLVKHMVSEEMNYPLHLGVTEAGEAEDGRIKSSVGIGTLLEDGLGDTIRVSLTEEPEFEIPVAKTLLERYENRNENFELEPIISLPYNPFFRVRRETNSVKNIGSKFVPKVIADLSKFDVIKKNDLAQIGYNYLIDEDKWKISDQAPDLIYLGRKTIDFKPPGALKVLADAGCYEKKNGQFPFLSIKHYNPEIWDPKEAVFLEIDADDYGDVSMNKLKKGKNIIIVLSSLKKNRYPDFRRWFVFCVDNRIKHPIIIKSEYNNLTDEQFLLYSSTDFGGLQTDGFGDGIWIKADQKIEYSNMISFGILQASRSRISKTEYISCPSCGRTLFDLQETTAKIRSRTSHLKGIKIGIMGCIVNGPGEMADADYGYVGTGDKRISLYKGQELVIKNIPVDTAVDSLINLMDKYGDWVDPIDD
tara:strand:+ start:34094 stop:36010 length:1917 start_codon:yes stop_codon:yes gene_type:complete